MELTNKPEPARVSLVHVHDSRVRWSVRASQVARIVAAAEWSAPAVDVVAMIGGAPCAPDDRRRVVVVRGAGDREIALFAIGPIDVDDVDPINVLPLPAALARAAPQVAGIVVSHDASLSLLLELAAVNTPEDSVSGEEPCPRRS